MLELNGPRQSLTVLGLNAAGINATGAREMEFGSEIRYVELRPPRITGLLEMVKVEPVTANDDNRIKQAPARACAR